MPENALVGVENDCCRRQGPANVPPIVQLLLGRRQSE